MDAFISYRRKPSAALALLIQEKLINTHKIDVYVDTTRADSTRVQFPERLMKAIEKAPVFVCLLGDDTLESEWVLKEINKAYDLKKRCIPVFQESYRPPSDASDAVNYLLSFDGVHVLDIKNIHVDYSVQELAALIKPASKANRLPLLLAAFVLILLLAGGVFLLPKFLQGNPTEEITRAVVVETSESGETAVSTATDSPDDTATNTATATPSPTRTLTPTATASPSRTATATRTPTLTPSPFPTSSVFGGNVSVTFHDDFNGPDLAPIWQGNRSLTRLQDGSLFIEGINDWWGVDYEGVITRSEGVLILFQIVERGDLNFILENGAWETAANKRWGLYGWRTNPWETSSQYATLAETFRIYGTASPRVGVWYYLLFRVADDGVFNTQLWEKDNPENYLINIEAQPTGSTWENRLWHFFSQVYSGIVRWDSFEELRFPENYTMQPAPENPAQWPIRAVGTFQSEIGCGYDWTPNCSLGLLEDTDGNGIYSWTSRDIPAGDWEVKITINDSWEINYGANGQREGANIPFTVEHDGQAVVISYNTESHEIEIHFGQ